MVFNDGGEEGRQLEKDIAGYYSELGQRVEIDGEWWVRYEVPEYETTVSIKCGSIVTRPTCEEQIAAERVVRGIEDLGNEPSPGLLVMLGLAIPRAANVKWDRPENDFTNYREKANV